jgi:hypothetical protein
MEGFMRLVSLAFAAIVACGAALAQPLPGVTIEDDVAPANATRCAALRMAQVSDAQRNGTTADPLIAAAHAAWMAYPGVDAAAAKAEAGRIAAAGATLKQMAADACETFEIRSLARPIG